MAEAEVNILNELTESNDKKFNLYKDYIYAAITKIRSSGKQPDTKQILCYLVKNVCININEDLLEKLLTSLTEQKKQNNRLTPKFNSYFIIDDCVNQTIGSLLTVDSKSVFSLKPSNIKTPPQSHTLGDCCDLSIHEKTSEVLERKSNNVEQQYYFEPSTILFNYFFEEIISLRSYVNEQLENVKKSQYNSKESAKCNHSTRTDELQHLREESRSKTEIIKLLPENIFWGNKKM